MPLYMYVQYAYTAYRHMYIYIYHFVNIVINVSWYNYHIGHIRPYDLFELFFNLPKNERSKVLMNPTNKNTSNH